MAHGLLGRTYIRRGKKRRAGWRSLGRAREGRVQPQRGSNQAAAPWPARGIRLPNQAERCRARPAAVGSRGARCKPPAGGPASLEALT